MTAPVPNDIPELLNPEAFPEYLIRDRREIVGLMRMLIDKRVWLSAHIGDGPFSFVTAVLDISDDAESIVLDASHEQAMNDRATSAEQLNCVTRVEGIRLQFGVATPARFERDGYAALRTPLPQAVLRLQRRESYRLAVPLSKPVSCVITVVDTDGQVQLIPVRVLNISNGGIAVVVPPNGVEFAAGNEFEETTLSIPEVGTASVTLRVCNVFHASSPNGSDSLRAGCEFVDLPARFTTQIQRYIFSVERDRRALGSRI